MFIQTSNAEGYNAFAKNAFDFDGRIRANDTEVKFLYDFFQNHFHKGNKFVIEIESTLYTCTSCQNFVTRLNNYTRFEKIKEFAIDENQTERLLLEKDLEVLFSLFIEGYNNKGLLLKIKDG